MPGSEVTVEKSKTVSSVASVGVGVQTTPSEDLFKWGHGQTEAIQSLFHVKPKLPLHFIWRMHTIGFMTEER